MTALYELSNQYIELLNKLDSYELDAATIADTIEASGITDDIATKAQSIEYLALEAGRYLPMIDAEIERLKKLKVSRERVVSSLRAYLLRNMQHAGIEKISCPLFTFSIRANPPAVDAFDPLSIPAEYFKAPPPVIDKTAIKKAITEGVEVPGARLASSVRLDVR